MTTFGYDSRDRLTSGTTWGSYTYDANSNRQSWLGTLGPMSYTVPSTSDHLTALNGSTVTTDASGNLTGKPGLALIFDDWSRLRTATAAGVTTTYGVNGLNERVSKTAGTTSRVYVYSAPGHLLGVYDGATGAALEELAYLGDRPTATIRSGTVYPIETDHLMAPLRVLDSSNTTVWSWEDREPFGASAPTEGTVGGAPFVFNLRFPGQWADAESGLVSNGFRDYDPVLGKYVEVDPLGLAAGMNPFGYVSADPLSKTDPIGLVSWNGTGQAFAGVDGVGAGFFRFELTSECVNGKRVHAVVLAPSLALGAGFKFTGSGSAVSFHDYNVVPDADVFNGGFGNIGAAPVFGGGGAYGKTRLGHAWTNTSFSGPVYGLDFSIGVFVGRSFVRSSEETSCGCQTTSNQEPL